VKYNTYRGFDAPYIFRDDSDFTDLTQGWGCSKFIGIDKNSCVGCQGFGCGTCIFGSSSNKDYDIEITLEFISIIKEIIGENKSEQ